MNEPARMSPERMSLETVDFVTPARRAVTHMIKMRARRYARRPLSLEVLHPGLASALPTTLIAIASHLVERETTSRRRWFGFGGEVGIVNARAALLLGRVLRQKENSSSKTAGDAQSMRQEP